mmetsp:Transcript_35940/g.89566  ORF Transcript_35940/g.89566 Transcript_35940/m.89566 type:complete len:170 (-) Transcript_35940:1652-2161(-)
MRPSFADSPQTQQTRPTPNPVTPHIPTDIAKTPAGWLRETDTDRRRAALHDTNAQRLETHAYPHTCLARAGRQAGKPASKKPSTDPTTFIALPNKKQTGRTCRHASHSNSPSLPPSLSPSVPLVSQVSQVRASGGACGWSAGRRSGWKPKTRRSSMRQMDATGHPKAMK